MSNSAKTGGTAAFNGISRARFGKSVESQAQIDDAAKEASAAAGDGEAFNVCLLVLLAAGQRSELTKFTLAGRGVVARTAVDARIVAQSANATS
ncbi:hypothetical protein [Rhizobium mongolense]|uniref:Uncharacterized protein n=1 Tax=Rhizobium mongolense TaxID=57676 RepID=A0A7W6RT37_9HYPH|nr:hypothetical protein [Rhizobium mongolense]MBB4278141.1 hypothetical protein [Rhizobium mongolense]